MATVTLPDPSLKAYGLEAFPRLKQLRTESFNRKPEICIERARYVTEYLRDMDNPADGPELRQARKIRHFLRNRTPVFHDVNLLAGGTTSKPLGAPLFPEFLALTLWPELETVSTRAKNPMTLSAADAEILNLEVFPFWMKRNVLERARENLGKPTPVCLDLFERMSFFLASKPATLSHTVPSYRLMLEKGLLEVCRMAEEKEHKAARAGSNGASKETAEFYRAVRISLEGIMDYAARLAIHARRLANRESDPLAKKELLDMAAVCDRVPAHPATTFREAVNALWISQVGIHAENINMAMSPGRLDQVLYPYYLKDMEAGRLDVARAIELVGCLWLKLSDNVVMVPEVSEELFGGSGTSPAVTLGGVDAEGNDAVNDLTHIMLKVTELLRIRDPNVNARYDLEANSKDYLKRVSEVILNTKAVPAVYNDRQNIAALVGQKETEEHARDYAIVGCVELASGGRDYVASSSILLNLVAPLEMALHSGKRPITGSDQVGIQTPDLRVNPPATFDEFLGYFLRQLDWVIERAIEMNETFGHVHQEMMPSPLLSAFFEGPLDEGKDLIRGGAVYDSSGATHIGFADVVDSLNAIEQAVFVDRKYTFAQILDGLDEDFANNGGGVMIEWLKHHTPRYGTDDPIALKNSKLLTEHLFQVYQKHTNYRGGPYRPAYWTMTNHAGLGTTCGALPHGRNAWQLLASGITPVSGAATDLTACMRAVASLGGANVPGCWAFNLKYTPLPDNASNQRKRKMVEDFANTVEAYFQLGGQQVQFNIMTYQMLMDAKAHPDRYRELMVRVSGYSAYFKDLNDLMKDELITRTQYNLGTGQAVPFPEEQFKPTPTPNPAASSSTALKTPAPAGSGIPDLLRIALGTVLDEFGKTLSSELAENFLEILLKAMKIVYSLPLKYRKNIEHFDGRYQFLSRDGSITVAVVFHDGQMDVREKVITNPDITITFLNGRSLMEFLLAPKQDVLEAMLHQKVKTEGNLNHLYKFGFMARQLQLLLKP